MPSRPPRELSQLQLALLVLYGAEGSSGASPYGVEKLIQSRMGGAHGFGKSACYEQSKNLAELGYLNTVTTEGLRKRPVTLYRITESGRQAVRRWASTRAQIPPIDSDVFLRSRAANFVPPQLIRNGLRYLRPELTSRLAQADELEAKLAHRVPPLHVKLELDLARTIHKAYLQWLIRAEKELAREIQET